VRQQGFQQQIIISIAKGHERLAQWLEQGLNPGSRIVEGLCMSTADFIERRRPRSPLDNGHALLTEAEEALKALGATWTRAQLTASNEFIVEGWRHRPRDEGDLPL
jgi:hypothetical protein